MKKKLLLSVLLSMSMFGCGSSELSGTLAMTDITATDLSGGTYKIDSTATYVPIAGKVATGAEINFAASYTTPSNSTPVIRPASSILSITGVATYTDLVEQGSEPVYLRLTASIGGLSQTKIISIPAISELSASPAAISFTNTDTVGTTSTATVTGGYPPYTVASEVPADIRADITGNTVTFTKFAPGSAVIASTKVTITDTKGNTYQITVGYFK